MSNQIKTQEEILKKLKISKLNAMQIESSTAILKNPEVLLLSPTGTGKTLAFLLPILKQLDPNIKEVQCIIVVPTRELALQIEQVLKDMGSGYKTNAVYGGQSFNQDRINLKHRPAIIVGTPGRLADHLRRTTFPTQDVRTLVLDEFDKSLEIGFDDEMITILDNLNEVNKKVLTSATQGVEIPEFVEFKAPLSIDYLTGRATQLSIKSIISPEKDKLETLGKAICHLGNQNGIIFCNFKNAIERISEYLTELNISHGSFHGGLEQQDRERALIKFRNGTYKIIIATDLAARGIDIPELSYIIHYHLPLSEEEFTHRNGRTARMNAKGASFVLHWEDEELPEFINNLEEEVLGIAEAPSLSEWVTVFVSGGRRDKISKGDIAGLFIKQGQLQKEQLGIIEIKQDCAFAAVKRKKAKQLIQLIDNSRLKKRKVRVKII